MAAVLVAIIVGVAAGVGAERRWGRRARRGSNRLLDVILYAVLPPVSFVLVTRLHLTVGTGVGLVYGLIAATTAGGLGLLIGRRLGLPRASIGALGCAALVANTGYLGLPLTAQVLGSDEISAAIAYDAIVSQIALYVFGFGIGALYGTRRSAGSSGALRAFLSRNPVLIALALALVAPDALAPDIAVDVAKAIVLVLLPVGFFVLGVNLMHEREDGALDFPPRMTLPIATAVGLRIVVAPATMLLLSLLFVSAPSAYKLESAMPTGINTLLIAHIFGLDLRLAAAAILWSTTIVVAAALTVGMVT